MPPWAGQSSRLIVFREALAIENLQACRTVKTVVSLLGLSGGAELAHDRFHVAKHLGEAVDQVRGAKNKAPKTWFRRQVYPMRSGEFLSQWCSWVVRYRLRPVIKVAKMLKRHQPNLLSSFRHRITNATSEGFNSVVQALKFAARGFGSFRSQNCRTRILFFRGKLDLRPRPPCP